ncbi:MAG: tetratricopeptide repeat protein [Planctomycetaceae bacterium]|nr:tetratricopeptide repeat protein [Planctomycetaceae bacterium]
MFCTFPRVKSWSIGLACAVAALGCSSNRLGVQSMSQHPDHQSVSVPGSADVSHGNELKHPATVHVAYARWQEQQRQLPQARESYQQALKHDPKSVDALLGLSRIDRHAGRMADAERLLTQAEKLRPNDPLIAAAWGEHYSATGRWTEAIARYRSAAEKAPDEALYRHQLAVALTRSGAVQEGLAAFSRIVAPAEAHYNVGYLLQQQGKLMEAEEQYQRALALKPDLAPAANMLAQVRRERGVPVQVAAAKPDASSSIQQTGGTAAEAQPETNDWQPRGQNSTVNPAVHRTDLPQAPSFLTPQQAEQWRNQQELKSQAYQ